MDEEKKDEGPKRYLAKLEDYKVAFGGTQGQKVLWDMMKAHSFVTSTMNENTPHVMAFREGERNVVLRILTILKQSPEKVMDRIKQGEQDDGY